jgi:hypothetical protein
MKLEGAIVCMAAVAIMCCGCIGSGSISAQQAVLQANDEITSALAGYTLVAYTSDKEYLNQTNTSLTQALALFQEANSTLNSVKTGSPDERRRIEAVRGVCEGYIAGTEGGLLFVNAMNQTATVRAFLYEYYMGDRTLIQAEFEKYHDTIIESREKYRQSREILASVDMALLAPELAGMIANQSAVQENQEQILTQATDYYRVLEYLFSSLDNTMQGDALSEKGDYLGAQLEYDLALANVGKARAIAGQLSASDYAEVAYSAENALEYLDYIEASVKERNAETNARIKESVIL